MFDLLGYAIEALVELAGDLFESGSEAAAEAAADSALDGAVGGADALTAVAPPVDALADVPTDAGWSGWGGDGVGAATDSGWSGWGGGDGFVAATDGGISPDRFDAQPVMGANNPFLH